MGAVAEQPREMLLGDLIAIREHRALAGVQSRETGAEPGACLLYTSDAADE